MAKPKRKDDPFSLGLVPVDDEADPFALGLIPVDDPDTDEPQDVSPQALGLVPANDEPDAAPQDSWDDGWIDWGTHKANQFIGIVQDAFGIEHAPEAANANMERREQETPKPKTGPVKPGKLFEEGSVLDAIVPDFVEEPIRAAGDWVTSPRTQKSLDAGAYAAGGGLMDLSKNAVGLVNYINDFLVEETGIGVKSDDAEIPFADITWGQLEKNLTQAEQDFGQWYGEERVAEGDRNFIDALVEALPQVPVMVAEFGAAGALLGPVKGFAALEALLAADEGVEGALWGAAKGAAMGAFFEWANILSRPLRVPVLAAAGGGMTAAAGGSDSDIIAQSILFPILGVPIRSGPIGAKYLREHGVMPDVRDLGGHVRDLLIGGNVGRAKTDMDKAAEVYKGVQAKHREETQREQARLAVEISSARGPQAGEMGAPRPEDIQTRIQKVQQDAQARMEDMRTRQMKAEMEARHAYDTAARRYNRAQAPFRTSFAEAPYARALQSAERRVLVENTDGYAAIQSANKAADDRMQAARDYAAKLREEAKTAESPESAQYKRDLADHIESEGGRLSYEMRRRVEDEIEGRISRAEAKAEKARADLAEALGKKNSVAGRRARVLAAERDVQEASRSGIRRLTRGAERAKRLIIMGDEHVARVERRLKEQGITKDDPATGAQYDAAMSKANEVRETYRDIASMQLLEAQYAADSRVSRAMYRRDLAIQAAETAGVPIDRLSRKRAGKDEDAKKRDENDDWDLPDEPGDIRRGPEFEHAYRKALEGSRDDPMLGQIAKDVDPILERIQDPSDVLPAINRIAQELGHKSKSTRGRQTAEKREILAEQLGMTEKEFIDSPHGRAFSDFEIEAALMLLRRQWRRVQEAHVQYKKTNSKVDGDRVRLEVMRMVMIVERIRGVAAEAGRALRMFREVKKEFGGVKDILTDSQLDKILFYDTPGKAYRITKKFLKGDWFGGIVEFWINGLLSGPQTWLVNLFSGINMLLYKPIQTAAAATVGLSRWALYRIIGRPLYMMLRTPYRALARTGALGRVRREKAQAKAGLVGDAREQTKDFSPSQDRVRFGEVGARVRGAIEALVSNGTNNAFLAFWRALWTGESRYNITNFGGKEHRAQIPWWLGGHIVRAPGRILQAIDEFMKAVQESSGIRAHAYRQAMSESLNLPNTPAGWAQRRARYQELAKNPSGKVLAAARQEALEVTFQQEPSVGMSWVSDMRRKAPVTAFLIPFHRILLNSLEFIVSGVPVLGLAYKRVRMDLFGYNGRARMDMALAHMMMVSGASYAIYLWAMQGNVQSGYGGPEAQRTAQGIAGPPPLAIRIPGTDQWITLNRVDPLGGIIALGSAAATATKAGQSTGDEDAAQQAFSILVSGVFSMSLERAGMKGIVDFIEAAMGGSYGNDINSADRFFQKLGATFTVPQAVAVAARTQDPFLRYADTLMEEIMARTPGQREKLWPVRNMWGSPIKGFDSYGDADVLDFTIPIYWGTKTKDPASLLILKLWDIYRWAPGTLDRTIEGRRLTPEEYDAYAQRAGQYSYEGIQAMSQSAEWQETEALDQQVRDLTTKIVTSKGVSKAQYKAWQKERADLREQLRKKRYAQLNKAKKVVAAARKKARADMLKRFPILERQKKKDLARVSGETPESGWFGWMEAEGEAEQFQADEEVAAEEGDTMSPEERRQREESRRAFQNAPAP